LIVGDLEGCTSKFSGISRTSSAMFWIGIFILPFAVVKERKEADDDDISAGACG